MLRDSTSGLVLGFAVALCCALPILLLSGFVFLGWGFALNQQALLIVGLSLVVVAGMVLLSFRKRAR